MTSIKIIDANDVEIGEIIEAAIGGFMWRKHWDGSRAASGAKKSRGSEFPNRDLSAVKKSAARALGNVRFEEVLQ